MAGKKRDGLGGLKDTTAGNRRDDRQVTGKTTFELFTIDAKNALTVILMLQSPEDNVVLKAVASLEGFGRKGKENLKNLCSLGVFSYLYPLIDHSDGIIKRFSLKLLGMLCSLEEFREQMFKVENVLNTFLNILEKETDVVLHEYATLALAELSNEYHAASDLLSVENCIEILFLRITSPDPDVEKNCLDIMNHLLNDINGIEVFIASPSFDITLLLGLIPSNYPTIQALAIEVLKQLTSWCRDTKILFAYRDAQGIELILEVLEKEEWCDLHQGALDLLINVVDSPDLCDYLLQSGCLMRLVNLMDDFEEKTSFEKVLGVLARMSQTRKGRTALHSIDMEEKFCGFLEVSQDGVQEPSCLGIANLAQNGSCLEAIMKINPVNRLLVITISREKNFNLRNLAAYALNILCNYNRKAAETISENVQLEELFSILTENSHLPTELCQNLIQVFMGISFYDHLRMKLISERFLSALISCIPRGDSFYMKDTSLQVDALECLSGYLIESEGRLLFDSLDGANLIINCLRSKFASVREWAGHLVIILSQSKDFVNTFIQMDGLEWMLKEKNTLHSMPSWQAGIEAIFSSCLPAKFAYTGRLDLQDITQDGFYISSNPTAKFILLDYFIKSRISPLTPVYVANFFSSNETSSESETVTSANNQPNQIKSHLSALKLAEAENTKKFLKGAERNSMEDFVWDGSLNTYQSLSYEESVNIGHSEYRPGKIYSDPYLNEYLEDLKRRIAKAESFFGDSNWHCIHPKLIRERARIIGELVADEMAGPEADPVCSCHYKQMHINELKFHLGSNVIPLGFIRMGSYLERAMLFKVLSDRIGFPCSLVRGPHGRSWVEIAVPVLNIEDFEEEPVDAKVKVKFQTSASEPRFSTRTSVTNQTSKTLSPAPSDKQSIQSFSQEDHWFPKLRVECFKAFPNYLLKPNAIVDLINVPGRILRINSVEAEEYMGNFLFSKS